MLPTNILAQAPRAGKKSGVTIDMPEGRMDLDDKPRVNAQSFQVQFAAWAI
jgi:hypothetical protein